MSREVNLLFLCFPQQILGLDPRVLDHLRRQSVNYKSTTLQAVFSPAPNERETLSLSHLALEKPLLAVYKSTVLRTHKRVTAMTKQLFDFFPSIAFPNFDGNAPFALIAQDLEYQESFLQVP